MSTYFINAYGNRSVNIDNVYCSRVLNWIAAEELYNHQVKTGDVLAAFYRDNIIVTIPKLQRACL